MSVGAGNPAESATTGQAASAAPPALKKGRGHLPIPLTSLIGRTAEAAEVAAWLDRSRLVTLTGPGGVGKTRLALAVAGGLSDGFFGGAWFVDLAPLTDPSLMVQAALSALGLSEQPGRAPWETLVGHLRLRRLLLLLDNCEHLVAACAHLAQTLLQECPGLCILATSRETLRVTGEVVWRVPSLSLPETGGDETESDAFRLFLERAALVDAPAALTPQTRTAITHICRRLDGIPLAIEMAAARTRAMTPGEIAARLDDRFRLLAASGEERVPRRQTLRATLDWSYDLLDAEERALLARLSVFADGWTLAAAEAACTHAGMNGLRAEAVLDVLMRLIDRSLVVYEERDGVGRYRLLETVRQYGQERLAEGGEARAVSRSHSEYFLGYAEQARLAGPEQAEWLNRLETEHENLRAALTWLQGKQPESALRLAGALARFWRVRGHLSEGRAFLAAALWGRSVAPLSAPWLEALQGDARLALAQGHFSEAHGLLARALDGFCAVGDRRGEAAALGDLGSVLSNQGDYPAARDLLGQALAINRAMGNREELAANLGGLGYVARETGDYPAAETFLSEAVVLSRDQGDALAEGSHLGSLAYVVLHRGDRDGARRLLAQTLSLYRGLGNRLGEAWTLSSLGHVAAEAGDVAAAVSSTERALEINRAVGNRAGQAWNLSTIGGLQLRQGRPGVAEATLQEALRINRETGNRADEAWTLNSLGDVSRAQSGGAAAHAFYVEALGRMRGLGMHDGLVMVLTAISEAVTQNSDHPFSAQSLAVLRRFGAADGTMTPEDAADVILADTEKDPAAD